MLPIDIVREVLTGFLENESQVAGVWAFFQIVSAANLVEKYYDQVILSYLKAANLKACENPRELLYTAIEKDDIWLLRLAIREGADINVCEMFPIPINFAIKIRSKRCLIELLKQPNIDPNNGLKHRVDLYNEPTNKVHSERLESLVRQTCEAFGHVDFYDEEDTALMCAIQTLDIECIEILLQHGVDFHPKNPSYCTALDIAKQKLDPLNPFYLNIWSDREALKKEKDALKQNTKDYLQRLIQILGVSQNSGIPTSAAIGGMVTGPKEEKQALSRAEVMPIQSTSKVLLLSLPSPISQNTSIPPMIAPPVPLRTTVGSVERYLWWSPAPRVTEEELPMSRSNCCVLL